MLTNRKQKSKIDSNKNGSCIVKKRRFYNLPENRPNQSISWGNIWGIRNFNKRMPFALLALILAGYFLIKIIIFSDPYSYSLIFSSMSMLMKSSLPASTSAEISTLIPGFTPVMPLSSNSDANIFSSPVVPLTPEPALFSTFVPKPIVTPKATSTFAPVSTPIIINNSVNYKFGISAGNTLPGLNDSELNKIFDDLAMLRIGWLRFDIDWQNIQYNDNSKFDWHNIDRIVEAANVRNIKLLPVLAYTPKWARSGECSDNPNCPPSDLSDYGIFVGEAVKRYKSKGIYAWEIWNEPNLAWYWRPAPNASQYVSMLKLAHITIKQQDPSAYIVVGGLGPGDIKKGDIHQLDFLKQLYSLGAQPYFEVLGFHPYSYPVKPSYFQQWSAWSQMEETAISLRNIMKDNGDDSKMIWLTEFGAPTNGPGHLATLNGLNLLLHPDHITEELQAEILNDSFTAVRKLSWAGPLFWYSYKDLGVDTSTNENFFGLLRYDGSKKPAYEMLYNILSHSKQ